MATLTTRQGIVWNSCKHNGKVAFCNGAHAIVFEDKTGLFHLKENGETVYVDRKVVACLEHADDIILDYHADKIIPSWEAA